MNKNIVYNIIKGRELDPRPCKECGVRPHMTHGSADWIEHAVVIVCVNPNCTEYGYQTIGDPEHIDNVIELWNEEQDESNYEDEFCYEDESSYEDEDYAYEQITQDPSLLLDVLDGKVRADLKDDEV